MPPLALSCEMRGIRAVGVKQRTHGNHADALSGIHHWLQRSQALQHGHQLPASVALEEASRPAVFNLELYNTTRYTFLVWY